MSTEIKISLAAARVNAGMTQETVAKELKVSKRTIINWERGDVSPSPVVLKVLSDMYRMPIDNIILPSKPT